MMDGWKDVRKVDGWVEVTGMLEGEDGVNSSSRSV